jgi:hypothetical protein
LIAKSLPVSFSDKGIPFSYNREKLIVINEKKVAKMIMVTASIYFIANNRP